VKAPGATKYPNVVCSRPLSSDNTLSDWRKLVEGGQNFRKSFTITLFDRNRVVKAWSFVRGWPVKWQLNELDASKNEVAIETLEIAHEGLSFSP
jgi:phage tail-like protein